MKNKIVTLIIIIYILWSKITYSQDWGRYWCFGDSAGINFSNPSSPVTFSSAMDNAWSCTSLGDSLNGLLCYAHCFYLPNFYSGSLKSAAIINKYHSKFINGDSLIGSIYGNLVLITKPGASNMFYLFQSDFSTLNGLYYSLVDPYFNNDSGLVIKKNVKLPLSNDTLESGILAIKHANGRDWWILCRNYTLPISWNSFLVTQDSIYYPIEQHVGSYSITEPAGMSCSKLGDRIVITSQSGLIEIYDFDRCTGLVTSPKKINFQPHSGFFGCEFSPNGNLLYVSETDNIFGDSLRLFQFDLTNVNPSQTVQKLYTAKDPASGGQLKRGPDDKIYFTCLYQIGWQYPDSCRNSYNENLGVIHNPDVFGPGCNFAPFSFYLGGKRTYWSLPNIPNFNLGPVYGSICDSLTNKINSPESQQEFSLYPNPANDYLYLIGKIPSQSEYAIMDIEGRVVKEGTVDFPFKKVDVSDLQNGYYIFSLNRLKNKIIIISKE